MSSEDDQAGLVENQDDNVSHNSVATDTSTASSSRHRYYSRLDPREDSLLSLPRSLAEQMGWFYAPPIPFDELKSPTGKQSSIVTIFTIWNTMMGTSLLSMPWALNQAGLVLGLFLMLAMAGLAFYTAYRVVQSPKHIFNPEPLEFSDVCYLFWGRKGEIMATSFSAIAILGGVIVYWVLMSNFLYNTGEVFRDALLPNNSILPIMENNTFKCDFYCFSSKHEPYANQTWPDAALPKQWWSLQGTVPVYLAILAFPLLNFKSPTIFTKFNVMGTFSVIYLMTLVTVKAVKCGFNLSFDSMDLHFAAPASWTFPSLTGTLALSYFIHGVILTILRNQEKPENNGRDLGIAYGLAATTYTYLAFVFYAAFPLTRKGDCLAQNFLDNFGTTGDILTAVARLFLLFQMLAIFPLLMYLLRAQISYTIIKDVYPGLPKVIGLNVSVLALSIVVAILFPNVGTIIRFVGSFIGLMYIFTLPSAVHLKRLQVQDKMSTIQIIIHITIVVAGVANFVAQFVMLF